MMVFNGHYSLRLKVKGVFAHTQFTHIYMHIFNEKLIHAKIY